MRSSTAATSVAAAGARRRPFTIDSLTERLPLVTKPSRVIVGDRAAAENLATAALSR